MKIKLLGQSGCLISFNDKRIIIDPYLSNSAMKLINSSLKRLRPTNFNYNQAKKIDWVFITHDHIDHCDPWTLGRFLKVNPNIRYMGPVTVVKILKSIGIKDKYIYLCKEKWFNISKEFKVLSIPACHPKIHRDKNNNLRCVGYLIKNRFNNSIIYHSGDTSVHSDIIKKLKKISNIKVALLPVNEKNFYKDRDNIIGNMSIREAFYLCKELKIPNLIPVHWDMFEQNSVHIEEIKLIYRKLKFRFKLLTSRINEI
tara:strand:- start:2265 stop:3032 length:768 start_codon:yes stop_codon:yes gene_type:complete